MYTGRINSIHDVRGKDGVGAKMDSKDDFFNIFTQRKSTKRTEKPLNWVWVGVGLSLSIVTQIV